MSNGQTKEIRDGWDKLKIIADVLSKLFIPIVVIVLPWFWSMYQLNLQKKQHEANIEEKAVDNFYKDIGSENPAQQNLAVGALKMVNPELAVKLTGNLTGLNAERKLDLAKSIVADSTQPLAVREEANHILMNVREDVTQPLEIRNRADEIIQRKPISSMPEK